MAPDPLCAYTYAGNVISVLSSAAMMWKSLELHTKGLHMTSHLNSAKANSFDFRKYTYIQDKQDTTTHLP